MIIIEYPEMRVCAKKYLYLVLEIAKTALHT